MRTTAEEKDCSITHKSIDHAALLDPQDFMREEAAVRAVAAVHQPVPESAPEMSQSVSVLNTTEQRGPVLWVIDADCNADQGVELVHDLEFGVGAPNEVKDEECTYDEFSKRDFG